MTWLITGLFKLPGDGFKAVWLHTIYEDAVALNTYNNIVSDGADDLCLLGVLLENWPCTAHALAHGDIAARFCSSADMATSYRYAIRPNGAGNFEHCNMMGVGNVVLKYSLMDFWLNCYGKGRTDGTPGAIGDFVHYKDCCGDYATGILAAERGKYYFVDTLPDNGGAVYTVAIKQCCCHPTLADLRDADNAEKREALAEIEASIEKVDSDITGYEEEITCKEAELTQMTAELGNAEKELKKLTARRDSIKEQLATKK